MTKPITPREVELRRKEIPAEVIDVFNRLILMNYEDGEAEVEQTDAVVAISEIMDCTLGEVYERGWLDVENIFRKVGWKVQYMAPDAKPGGVPPPRRFVFKKKL